MLFHISHDLALAALSCHLGLWDEAVKSILGAVSRSFDAGNFTLMQEICRIILPEGESLLVSLLALTGLFPTSTAVSINVPRPNNVWKQQDIDIPVETCGIWPRATGQ